MKLESGFIAGLMLIVCGCGIRARAPGQPSPDSQVVRPDKVTSFAALYGANCAGCHGADLHSTDREVPDLTDAVFKSHWVGKTIFEKFAEAAAAAAAPAGGGRNGG